MNMDFSLVLTQEQKLVMTQEMQLSVKLLQMSSMELEEYVEKEIQENPVLDLQHKETLKDTKDKIDYKELIKYFEFDNYGHRQYEKNEKEEVSPFAFITEEKSLKEYLKEQISELNEKDLIKNICNYICENIDSRGYLDTTIDEIGEDLKIPREVMKHSLEVFQTLEPDGIGARDLKECLKIQIEKKNNYDSKNDLELIIDNYLELIAENKYVVLSKKMNIDVKKAQEYGDLIKRLNPKPSRGYYTGDEVKYITPDAYIKKIDNEYFIIMNDDIIPKLKINKVYKEIINNETDKDAVDYVKEKLNSAIFLIKSIDHRKSTIYRVLEKIIEIQKEYFDFGEAHLKPMTLKEIAESLDMHESTISRAIREKYIYTNRGTIRIKDLFTGGIASSSSGEDVSVTKIKACIKELINNEEKSNPLSDQAICDRLNSKGVNISRRTVAKYREELGIKSSKARKRF